MRIACHQPNFIPWYPLFSAIASVDIFVLLGHCQFEKNGFQNRFRLHENDAWHTMSVRHGREPIVLKKYVRPQEDWKKIKADLPQFPVLNEFDDCVSDRLWLMNTLIIERILSKLDIKTRIEFDWPTKLRGTERLVAICQEFECDTYLAGSGGANYMEPELFAKAGIKIERQEYEDKRHVLEVLR